MGLKLSVYEELKPAKELRAKIQIFTEEALAALEEGMQGGEKKFNLVGSFNGLLEEVNRSKQRKNPAASILGGMLYFGFSLKMSEFTQISAIIFSLYKQSILQQMDLVTGVNVVLTNFLDTLVDYPKAKQYLFRFLNSLAGLGILDSERVDRYKQHVEQLEQSLE